MTRPVVVENARIVDPAEGVDEIGTLLVADGVIVARGAAARNQGVPDGAEVVDGRDLVVAPGLVDMMVRVGEPGAEHRETIASASEAAAAGGVTTMVVLPDTRPAIDDPALVTYFQRRAAGEAIVRVHPLAAATRGLEGKELGEYGLLIEAGAVGLAQVRKPIASAKVMRLALTYSKDFGATFVHQPYDRELAAGGVMNEGELAARLGLPGAPVEAETVMLARDLALARLSGARYHAARITCAESVRLIRRAKEDGADVTASIPIAHLSLNENDVGLYRTFFKLTPPLRSEADRQAVIDAVSDGTIDVVVSDHDPQDVEGKRRPFEEASDGTIGLETLLCAGLRLVHDERLSLSRLVEAISVAPARRLGLEAGTLAPRASGDFVLFDLEEPWVYTEDLIRSRSGNTAFEGARFSGRVVATYVGGERAFRPEDR